MIKLFGQNGLDRSFFQTPDVFENPLLIESESIEDIGDEA
jgi:hypothetical protein